MSQPQLFVIAGPNGAGKSTFSKFLVGEAIPVFDGDKEFADLQRRFPGLDEDALFNSVNDNLFPERKYKAISRGDDFAFETNFTTADIMNSVNQFKAHEYTTNLIYLGLPSIETAVERVNLRVSKGGHNVPVGNIIANYKDGLYNLHKFVKNFDHSLLMENNYPNKQKIERIFIAKFTDGKLIRKADRLPGWADMVLNKKFAVALEIINNLQYTAQSQKKKR